ncbi:carbonic anhydrase [Candidatus Liberibacter africanus]|uniref:Carbonic anhydrase n=1 Tax=Candidatus Liberibacter africanus PTSAPSY TaxID=1277257 RepID=A0A0G3I6U5_LIBAF|nr:carbonic anhydrase [Candidatus Liberibacter africanus]AKK20253.1 carbonate dehydratase [Candidatus Liberibacter africanus PTSAPSY]QTP64021.1 carbonic anhydrase [Candidatus Liberibacter africanus]
MSEFPNILIKRHREFIENQYDKELFQKLANQQKPKIMIISCCDSRVAPETIFNAKPGELFVVRNVANVVPPYEPDGHHHATSAAIEFAVQGLNVEHIVIMGHGRCGGIQAALNPNDPPLSNGDFIEKWIGIVRPLIKEIVANNPIEKQTALEQLSIRNSLKNIRQFPFVKKLEQENILKIHGAWFNIISGELWILDPKSNEFICNPK